VSKPISRERFALTSSAATATLGFVRAPSKVARFSYEYASNFSIEHPLNGRMIGLWSAVKRETNGMLDVHAYPNDRLGGDTALSGQRRSGAVQFFTLDGGILQSVVPVSATPGVGFAFKCSADACAASDGAFAAYVRGEIASRVSTPSPRCGRTACVRSPRARIRSAAPPTSTARRFARLPEPRRRRGMVNGADTAGFRARLADFCKRRKDEFGETPWGLLESHSGKLA
jgi:hypothetical protein